MFSNSKLNVLHAHPSIKSGFLFSFFFLGGGEKFVTSGCCPSILDVFVCVILHAIHLLSQLLRLFSATDGAVSLFLFGVDGSVTVLVSQWDRSKTIVIKEKCKLVHLELVRPILWRQSLDSLEDEFYKT